MTLLQRLDQSGAPVEALDLAPLSDILKNTMNVTLSALLPQQAISTPEEWEPDVLLTHLQLIAQNAREKEVALTPIVTVTKAVRDLTPEEQALATAAGAVHSTSEDGGEARLTFTTHESAPSSPLSEAITGLSLLTAFLVRARDAGESLLNQDFLWEAVDPSTDVQAEPVV